MAEPLLKIKKSHFQELGDVQSKEEKNQNIILLQSQSVPW